MLPHLTCCVIAALAVVQVRSCVESAEALASAFARLALVVASCCAQVGGGTGDPASRRRGASSLACAAVPAHHEEGGEQKSRVRCWAGRRPRAWYAPPRSRGRPAERHSLTNANPVERREAGRENWAAACERAPAALETLCPPFFKLQEFTCIKYSHQQQQRGRRQAQSALSHIAGTPLSLAVPCKNRWCV